MQKIATKIFISASLLFGIIGIIFAISGLDPDDHSTGFQLVLTRIFMCTVFVILSSFALSVAGKYLNGQK